MLQCCGASAQQSTEACIHLDVLPRLTPARLPACPRAPAVSVDETYGVVKESEADQILRNKALIIDEIESTVSCSPDLLPVFDT